MHAVVPLKMEGSVKPEHSRISRSDFSDRCCDRIQPATHHSFGNFLIRTLRNSTASP